jgi:hypothetical protein
MQLGNAPELLACPVGVARIKVGGRVTPHQRAQRLNVGVWNEWQRGQYARKRMFQFERVAFAQRHAATDSGVSPQLWMRGGIDERGTLVWIERA